MPTNPGCATPAASASSKILRLDKANLATVLLGPDGEVQPYRAMAVLPNQQLVQLLSQLSGVRYQDGCIFYR
jgi:hypothetical protein